MIAALGQRRNIDVWFLCFWLSLTSLSWKLWDTTVHQQLLLRHSSLRWAGTKHEVLCGWGIRNILSCRRSTFLTGLMGVCECLQTPSSHLCIPLHLPGCREDLKPSSLMRKSPSLESVIKSSSSFSSQTPSFSYGRFNSNLRWAPDPRLRALLSSALCLSWLRWLKTKCYCKIKIYIFKKVTFQSCCW